MNFGERLKNARQKAGFTQKALADALGVSLRTITNYESGKRYPKKHENYEKIASILHIDTNYLLLQGNESRVTLSAFTEEFPEDAAPLFAEAFRTLVRSPRFSENDTDDLMKELLDIYWKEKAARRQ